MASLPVRTPAKEIVIIPSRGNCAPRFGGQAAKQHDMNDATRALLGFHDEMRTREEAMKDAASAKALEKMRTETTMQKQSKTVLIVGFVLWGIAFAAILKFLNIL